MYLTYFLLNAAGDRLLNIDIPMSVGVMQPREITDQVNLVDFVWDLDKEASIWVQVIDLFFILGFIGCTRTRKVIILGW